MPPLRPILVLLLLVPLTLPARADPGGSDAPGDWTSATPIGPGNHTGVVGPRDADHADWYAIPHGPGEGIRVTIVTASNVTVRSTVAAVESPLLNATPVNATHLRYVETLSGPGVVHVGFRYGGPAAQAYSLDVEVVPVADLVVREIRVTHLPVCTMVVCTPSPDPLHFEIHVRLANEGLLPYTGRLGVYVHGDNGYFYDIVATQGLGVSPGAEIELTYAWQAVAAGNVTIEARATPDPDRFDNQRLQPHVILAEAPGVVAYTPA